MALFFSAVICVVCVASFLYFYLKSKGRYDEYIEYVDKEEYGLKDFIPLGLAISEIQLPEKLFPMAVRTFLARHRNEVYQKILEIRGPRDVEFYFYIHQGYRLTVGLVAAVGASAAGVVMNSQGSTDGVALSLVAALSPMILPFLTDATLDGQVKERRLSIQMEFPEFVSKLTLLVNAGMTISRAWEKIINENKKDHILYEEMQYASAEIKAGRPEAVAYEQFARRCHVKEVTKFVSVIVMNLRRGGAEVIPVLKEQGNECWEMRKNAARELGEQASTKILIPMMIMFLGIVLIVATPAVLSMMSGM